MEGPSPTEAFGVDLGIYIFYEEDVNEVLDECFDNEARDGDLSPRHQRRGFKTKKTIEKQHSWDDKVTEGFAMR